MTKESNLNADAATGAEGQTPALGMLGWLWLSAVVIIADQATKLWITEEYVLGERTPVFSFFNIVRAHNHGAAFSFLADAGGWQRWFFAGIAVVVSTMLFFWLRKLPKTDRWVAVALTLILGGALGNLYDRIVLGYVVDFLDFYWGTSHFPAFNIADSAISVGAVMLGVDIIRNPGGDSGTKSPEAKGRQGS
jgi:signal peptidase II